MTCPACPDDKYHHPRHCPFAVEPLSATFPPGTNIKRIEAGEAPKWPKNAKNAKKRTRADIQGEPDSVIEQYQLEILAGAKASSSDQRRFAQDIEEELVDKDDQTRGTLGFKRHLDVELEDFDVDADDFITKRVGAVGTGNNLETVANGTEGEEQTGDMGEQTDAWAVGDEDLRGR